MVKGEGVDGALLEHQQDLLWKGMAARLDQEAQAASSIHFVLDYFSALSTLPLGTLSEANTFTLFTISLLQLLFEQMKSSIPFHMASWIQCSKDLPLS